MKKWQSIVRDFIALGCGSLLTLSFAPFNIFPFAILAPAGLLLLTYNASPRRSAFRGFLFGLSFFSTGVYWVFISVHFFGDVPIPLSLLITAALMVILACYPAFALYAMQRFFPLNTNAKFICGFPAIWVLTEWLRSILFTGFPWLLLGYSQTNSPLKGFAPVLSVYGVSLVVLICSGCLINILNSWREKNYRKVYQFTFAMLGLFVFGSALCYVPWTKQRGEIIPVSLVQGNIPQTIKWSPEHLQFSLNTYQKLTENLLKEKNKPTLIIWPEAAIPMVEDAAQDYLNYIEAIVKEKNNIIILGIPQQGKNSREFFNAIISLGDEKATYIKRHLVPFGEYTPFGQYTRGLLSIMDIPMSDLVAGAIDQEPFRINGSKVAASICYEIAFPELIRSDEADLGFLLTITNNGWFGKSSAAAELLQMAQMRALELARPVVMVGNDGYSAIIGPTGKIDASAPLYQRFVLDGQVQAMYGLTPWMKFGMDPIFIILFCLLYIAKRNEFKVKFAARFIADTKKEPVLKADEE